MVLDEFSGLTVYKKPYSLICAYYFHQLLPAITAVTYEREINHLPIEQPTFIYIPHITEEEKKLISATYPWCTFISTHHLLGPKIAFQKCMPIKIGEKILRLLYKKDFFETIYFAHHATSDFTAQTFIQAFPNAKSICYGDGFGNFIDQDYLKPLIKNNVRNIFSWLKQRIKRIGCNFINPEKTLLMIPVNLSKNHLKTSLQIPSKTHAKQVLNALQKNNTLFNQYIDSCCNEFKNKTIYLFLLNNLSHSKLMSTKNECLLYQAIIEKHVPQKSVLLLKPHAGGNRLQIKTLADWAIKKGYIVKIFPALFFTMPIELAGEILKNYSILSTSYATISLQYFYNISAIHALDDNLIERYFFPSKKEWVKHQNKIYTGVEKKLNTWDGNRILWEQCF